MAPTIRYARDTNPSCSPQCIAAAAVVVGVGTMLLDRTIDTTTVPRAPPEKQSGTRKPLDGFVDPLGSVGGWSDKRQGYCS
jgi:hypothetical protein